MFNRWEIAACFSGWACVSVLFIMVSYHSAALHTQQDVLALAWNRNPETKVSNYAASAVAHTGNTEIHEPLQLDDVRTIDPLTAFKSTGLTAPRGASAAISDSIHRVESDFVDNFTPPPTPRAQPTTHAAKTRTSERKHLPHVPGMTAVLLATRHDQDGFPRLLSCLASLSRFLAKTITVVFLVVPDAEKNDFVDAFVKDNRRSPLILELLQHGAFQADYLSLKRPYQIEVHADSEILSAPRSRYEALTPESEKAHGGRGAGYRIQMLLKLAVAKLVRTKFYVTLDQDVFASRVTRMSDIVIRGKAIYQGEGEGEGGLGRTQHHGSWWQDSERLLQCEGCHQGKPTIGVTPAILSRTIALEVASEVESLYRGQFTSWNSFATASLEPPRWDEILFHLLTKKGSHDWTEYTLYWAVGCKKGLLERYHTLGPPLPGTIRNLRLYGYWGWNWGSKLKPAEFKNKHTVFGVLQSISGANGGEVAAQLAPFIMAGESDGASTYDTQST